MFDNALAFRDQTVTNTVNNGVTNDSLIDVNRISVDIVKEAMKHIKDGKKDNLYDFSSECLTNAPPELAEHIATLFRSFAIHGYVSTFIL